MIEFTLTFLHVFARGMILVAPVVGFLLIVAVSLGISAGRRMGLKVSDSLYWTFITATTVGYGDIPPKGKIPRTFAVFIAIIGLITSGIIVSLAVTATTYSIKKNTDIDEEMITTTIEQVESSRR